MRYVLLAVLCVLQFAQNAHSQSTLLLKQADGLRVRYEANYRTTITNLVDERMDTWGIIVYIENLTNDVLTYKISWNFRKYPDFQLNPAKRWAYPYADQDYEYSGEIGPREIIKKSGLPQNTLSSCDDCIKKSRINTWEVTNKSSQVRAQQEANQRLIQEQQQRDQYRAYQAEQQRLQEEATMGTVLFMSDVQVTVRVIGSAEFVLQPNVPQSFRYIKGEMLVDIIPTVAPDKAKREIISVVAGGQVVKNIALASQFGEADRARALVENQQAAQKEAERKAAMENNKPLLQFVGKWKEVGLRMDSIEIKKIHPAQATIQFYPDGRFMINEFLIYTKSDIINGALIRGAATRFEGNEWELHPTEPNSIYLHSISKDGKVTFIAKRLDEKYIAVACSYEGSLLITFFEQQP